MKDKGRMDQGHSGGWNCYWCDSVCIYLKYWIEGFMKGLVTLLLSYSITEETVGPLFLWLCHLADTSLKTNCRLRQSYPHSESKLYKTRHMISKYHLKLLKNNNVDGDILKHLASLPHFLLVTFSSPTSLFPPLFPLPSLSPSCALVTLVILFCWRVSVVLPMLHTYYYQASWQVPM